MAITIQNIKLNFPSLFVKQEGPNGGKAKFKTEIIIPKGSPAETALKAEYDKVVRDTLADPKKKAKEYDITPFTRGISKEPGLLINCDDPRNAEKYQDEQFRNCWILRANSDQKPLVIDSRHVKITANEAEEIRSGTVGNVNVNFYWFDAGVNKGVACGLNGFQKTADGVAIGGGRPSEEDMFGPIPDDGGLYD